MAKLFVFGIGGTGSRVIKSLTMLLGSGVKLNGFDFIPIIIDPDVNNGDLTRTIDILNYYKAVRSKLTFNADLMNSFFETKIGFDPDAQRESFRLVLSNTENQPFRGFINYPGLNTEDKALMNMLFSQNNMNSSMVVGFEGNPNIGSIVLNQFKTSDMYQQFSGAFGQNDRIFIISSIFGGTGASGFPLLLKNLKESDPNVSNFSLIQQAPIGAVTVLPYFGVKPSDSSSIDQSTFISKAKAALHYYQNNVNNQVNSLYYIGDHINRQFENNKGANAQKNDAHFVELAAALSIVDFAYKPDQTLKAGNVSYEFGIKASTVSISFKDLADSTKNIIAEPLTMFVLFDKFLEEYLPNNLEQAAWRDGTPIDGTFLKNTFYSDSLKNYRDYFRQWLAEMANNSKAFVPFDLSESLSKSLFDIVLGYKPEISFFEKGKNFSRIQHHCNRAQNGMKVTSPEDKFMSVMYKALETTVKEKYKF